MALDSSFVILDLGEFIFLKMDLISPLNSSASPCFTFWHTFSTWAMYCPIGGSCVIMAKLGP